MRRFPLLDGDEYDVDTVLSTHPTVMGVTHPRQGNLPEGAIVLDETFEQESLPSRLTEVYDGSPTTPLSHDGLLSGNNNSEITLTTGVTSGDATVVQLADGGSPVGLDWNQWSEIHVFTRLVATTSSDGYAFLTFGDDKDPRDMTEGFKFEQFNGANGDIAPRPVSGGSDLSSTRYTFEPETFGFSLIESENPLGTGHVVKWVANGEPLDSWEEDRGFPASGGSHTLSLGCATTTSAAVSVTFDRLLIILVP